MSTDLKTIATMAAIGNHVIARHRRDIDCSMPVFEIVSGPSSGPLVAGNLICTTASRTIVGEIVSIKIDDVAAMVTTKEPS